MTIKLETLLKAIYSMFFETRLLNSVSQPYAVNKIFLDGLVLLGAIALLHSSQ